MGPRFGPARCRLQGPGPLWEKAEPGSVWGVTGLHPTVTPYSAIDTWPGRRSGGMIVITSILGSLPFFLLVGFAGAIVLSLM